MVGALLMQASRVELVPEVGGILQRGPSKTQTNILRGLCTETSSMLSIAPLEKAFATPTARRQASSTAHT